MPTTRPARARAIVFAAPLVLVALAGTAAAWNTPPVPAGPASVVALPPRPYPPRRPCR